MPFRNLVVGLLSHQLLVQLIGTLLLQGSSFLVKSERTVLPMTSYGHSVPLAPTSPTQKTLVQEKSLPGMLSKVDCGRMLL